MSSSTGALGALASANSYIEAGLVIAGVTVPLIKGLITDIKQMTSGGGTVTYEVVVQQDEASLQNTVTLSIADLEAINAELTRLKQTPVTVPSAPEPPAAPPAPAA
jgi:hypothetical protein